MWGSENAEEWVDLLSGEAGGLQAQRTGRGGWSWKEQSLIHKAVHLYLPAPRRGSQAVTKTGDGF